MVKVNVPKSDKGAVQSITIRRAHRDSDWSIFCMKWCRQDCVLGNCKCICDPTDFVMFSELQLLEVYTNTHLHFKW